MTMAIFVTIWSASISTVDIVDHMQQAPLEWLRSNQSVQSVEFYTPASGDVPKMDDIPSPALIVQINVDDLKAAETITDSSEFQALFTARDKYPAEVDKLNLEILEPVNYALPGQTEPAPRTAALSFVVRYYGPVEDGAQFVDFYTRNHPPILAKFPGIRNVLCYLPPDWKSRGMVEKDQLVIGNEVVFDDLDALNNALATKAVLDEARADSAQFQSYGYNSHHAMQRKYVYQKP